MKFLNSIKYKLIFFVTILIVLPALSITVYSYITNSSTFEDNNQESLSTVNRSYENAIRQLLDKGTEYGEFFANNDTLLQAINYNITAKDNYFLLTVLEKYYKTYDLDLAAFVSAEGVVLARGHDAKKFNDNVSKTAFAQKALKDQKKRWDYKIETSGVVLSFAIPLKEQDTFLGYVDFGFKINNEYLQTIKNTVNADLVFVLKDGQQAIATTIENFDTASINSDLLNASFEDELHEEDLQVKDEKAAEKPTADSEHHDEAADKDHQEEASGKAHSEMHRQYIEMEKQIGDRYYSLQYLPVRNADNEVFASMIVLKDITKTVDTRDNNLLFSIVMLVVWILIGGGLTIFIASVITKPLIQLSNTVQDTESTGDFSLRVDVNSSDEAGQTAMTFNSLMESLQTSFGNINEVMSAVADSDLSTRVTGNQQGDLNRLKESVNQSLEMLSRVLAEATSVLDGVNSGANELSNSAQVLADGTSQQAASLEEISSTMQEISGQTEKNNENAEQASQLTQKTLEVVQQGVQQMENMVASINEIDQTSKSVSKVIKVIDEIAFQTNLLALNAAVEAARAGKYGKGFAVVAEEVRNLANRSAEAAKNTTELIENSTKEVENGVANADKTASTLTEINEAVKKANDIVVEIASASKQQSEGIQEINTGLNQVNNIVQQNSSISEETASASTELLGQSSRMSQIMSQFKLKAAGGGPQTVAEPGRITPVVESQTASRNLLEDELGTEQVFLGHDPLAGTDDA